MPQKCCHTLLIEIVGIWLEFFSKLRPWSLTVIQPLKPQQWKDFETPNKGAMQCHLPERRVLQTSTIF